MAYLCGLSDCVSLRPVLASLRVWVRADAWHGLLCAVDVQNRRPSGRGNEGRQIRSVSADISAHSNFAPRDRQLHHHPLLASSHHGEHDGGSQRRAHCAPLPDGRAPILCRPPEHLRRDLRPVGVARGTSHRVLGPVAVLPLARYVRVEVVGQVQDTRVGGGEEQESRLTAGGVRRGRLPACSADGARLPMAG